MPAHASLAIELKHRRPEITTLKNTNVLNTVRLQHQVNHGGYHERDYRDRHHSHYCDEVAGRGEAERAGRKVDADLR
eukprot:3493068-Prymnesium_polylepis.2